MGRQKLGRFSSGRRYDSKDSSCSTDSGSDSGHSDFGRKSRRRSKHSNGWFDQDDSDYGRPPRRGCAKQSNGWLDGDDVDSYPTSKGPAVQANPQDSSIAPADVSAPRRSAVVAVQAVESQDRSWKLRGLALALVCQVFSSLLLRLAPGTARRAWLCRMGLLRLVFSRMTTTLMGSALLSFCVSSRQTAPKESASPALEPIKVADHRRRSLSKEFSGRVWATLRRRIALNQPHNLYTRRFGQQISVETMVFRHGRGGVKRLSSKESRALRESKAENRLAKSRMSDSCPALTVRSEAADDDSMEG